jgi:hypothetical protein
LCRRWKWSTGGLDVVEAGEIDPIKAKPAVWADALGAEIGEGGLRPASAVLTMVKPRGD